MVMMARPSCESIQSERGIGAGSERGMPAIASRAIRQIHYDPADRTLFVTFRDSGKTYVYFDVPPRVYGDFLAAESHGEFFSHNIRDAYRHEIVSDPRA